MKAVWQFILLSRPFNVLITLIAFLLACFLSSGKTLDFLSDPQTWFASLCLTVITATGYWVNDIYDYKIDRINKPSRVIVSVHLSVKKVFTAYFSAIFLVMVFSWFMLDEKILSLLNLIAIGLLFIYASWLKRTSVVGNLLIAALTALVIYYAAILFTARMPVMWMILFAFEITFLRELTKDVEDIRGDLSYHLQTFPIRVGIRITRWVLQGAYMVFLASCYLPFMWEYMYAGNLNWTYLAISVGLVQLPCVYLMYLVNKGKEPEDFTLQSKMLKWVIFPGMLSVFFLH